MEIKKDFKMQTILIINSIYLGAKLKRLKYETAPHVSQLLLLNVRAST